jgi:hypothetical protein
VFVYFVSNQAQEDRLHKSQGYVDGLVSNRFVHSLSTGTHKGMLSLLVM